jgi:hypothetical protein
MAAAASHNEMLPLLSHYHAPCHSIHCLRTILPLLRSPLPCSRVRSLAYLLTHICLCTATTQHSISIVVGIAIVLKMQKQEGRWLNKVTYIIRRIFPLGVSQHQSTDLYGAIEMQSVRGWLWIWCLVSKARYNVDWGPPNHIATDCSAVNEE